MTAGYAPSPIGLALGFPTKNRFQIPKIVPPFAKPALSPYPAWIDPGTEAPPAARLNDPIAHSNALSLSKLFSSVAGWVGTIATIAVAVVAVAAIIVTGPVGLALVGAVLVGAGATAMAAGGAMMAVGQAGKRGAEIGSQEMGPPTGMLMPPPVNVLINSKIASYASITLSDKCSAHNNIPQMVAQGSTNVFYKNLGAAREGDKMSCGAAITAKCSENVFIGGGTETYEDVASEIPDELWEKWDWYEKWGNRVFKAGVVLAVVGASISGGAAAVAKGGSWLWGGVAGGSMKGIELGVFYFVGKGVNAAGGAGGKTIAWMQGHDWNSLEAQKYQFYGEQFTQIPWKAGAAGMKQMPGYKGRFNAGRGRLTRGLETGSKRMSTKARTAAQRAQQRARATSRAARAKVNRAIAISYLSARLSLSQPKMGTPKPPTPRVIQVKAGQAGSAKSPLSRNSGGGGKGTSRTTTEYVKGTMSPKGAKTNASKVIPPKPMKITTHKKNSPSKQVKDDFRSVKSGKPKPKTKLIAGTPKHKAARWKAYKEKNKNNPKALSYKKWSNVYKANMTNASRANKAMDSYQKQIGWGKREVTVNVKVDGKTVKRRLDIADKSSKRGIEHKTGKQSHNATNKYEIKRDAALIKKGWKIEWVFEGTASKPLLNALDSNGIPYKIISN